MRFKVAAVDNDSTIHIMYITVSYFRGQVKLRKTKISDKVSGEVERVYRSVSVKEAMW